MEITKAILVNPRDSQQNYSKEITNGADLAVLTANDKKHHFSHTPSAEAFVTCTLRAAEQGRVMLKAPGHPRLQQRN